MTENEAFKALFQDYTPSPEAQQDAAELEKLAASVKPAPKHDGVFYVADEKNPDGHTISRYRVQLAGKTILWALVDNDLVSFEAPAGLPTGATTHVITLQAADRSKLIATKGLAVRLMHNDGTGVHVDGTSIQAYLVPRMARFLVEMYGI